MNIIVWAFVTPVKTQLVGPHELCLCTARPLLTGATRPVAESAPNQGSVFRQAKKSAAGEFFKIHLAQLPLLDTTLFPHSFCPSVTSLSVIMSDEVYDGAIGIDLGMSLSSLIVCLSLIQPRHNLLLRCQL